MLKHCFLLLHNSLWPSLGFRFLWLSRRNTIDVQLCGKMKTLFQHPKWTGSQNILYTFASLLLRDCKHRLISALLLTLPDVVIAQVGMSVPVSSNPVTVPPVQTHSKEDTHENTVRCVYLEMKCIFNRIYLSLKEWNIVSADG